MRLERNPCRSVRCHGRGAKSVVTVAHHAVFTLHRGLLKARHSQHRRRSHPGSVSQLRSARVLVRRLQNLRTSRSGLHRHSQLHSAFSFARRAQCRFSASLPFVHSPCPTTRWFRPPTRCRVWVPAAPALRRLHSVSVGLHVRDKRMKLELELERNPCWSARCHRHGAKSVAAVARRAAFTVASRPVQSSALSALASPSSRLSQSASFRAHLRSSFSESQNVALRVASSPADSRSVFVRPESTVQLVGIASLRSLSVPNKPLVPTAHPLSRLGSRAIGAAAAQRRRYARKQ
jgi:hypothetical protein